MKIKKVRLERYKALFSNRELNVLFVSHSYLTVGDWKKLRKQGDQLGFWVLVVKTGLLNGSFIKEQLHKEEVDFSGANALIIFKTSVNENSIINFVNSHRKLFLLGGRFSNSETYRSFPSSLVKINPFRLVDLIQNRSMIDLLDYNYISLLKVLNYGNNKSSSS